MCARCGVVLATSSAESAAQESEPALPVWMQSMQRGGEPQLVASGAANGTASGAVAAVAILPVQVRRSRGPLLTVDAGSGATSVSASGVAVPGSEGASLSANGEPVSTRAGSRRLRLILLMVIIIAALAYLVLRFGI